MKELITLCDSSWSIVVPAETVLETCTLPPKFDMFIDYHRKYLPATTLTIDSNLSFELWSVEEMDIVPSLWSTGGR